MVRALVVAIALISLTGCEAVDPGDELGQGEGSQSTQFSGSVGGPGWSWPAQPAAFAAELEKALVTEVTRLPAAGDSKKPAWTALPWSAMEDSTNARRIDGELSPVQKYDATYNDWSATKNFIELQPFSPERCGLQEYDEDYYKQLGSAAEWMSRHRGNWSAHDGLDSDNDKTVDECDDLDGLSPSRGLSHAWAAAAMVEPEPVLPVTIGSVTFWPSDIKALLLTVYDNSNSFVLTGACQSSVMERWEDGSLALKGCEGMNAGEFHVILTNFIGRFEAVIAEEFITDQGTTARPIDSYIVELQRELEADEAIELLGLEANDEAYSLNPDARGWLEVRVTTSARDFATVGHWGQDAAPEPSSVAREYHYVLELDAEQRVIGGQWIDDEKEVPRADYLWIAQGPRFARSVGKISPESPAAGNPFVRYSDVMELSEQSQAKNTGKAIEVQANSESP